MVIQFIVSMVFIFWIGHMYNQFSYMATENENYNRKGIFNISMVDKNYSLLKDELYKNKRIEKIGLTSNPFGGITAETHIKEMCIRDRFMANVIKRLCCFGFTLLPYRSPSCLFFYE